MSPAKPKEDVPPIDPLSRTDSGPVSINEPPGSTVWTDPGAPTAPGGETPGGEIDAPDLLEIEPDFAVIGDADLDLYCSGDGFDATCIITFNGGDEPTTFANGVLSTIVKPSTATTPGEYPVTVKNAAGESEPLMFEFLEPARAVHAKARPKKPAKTPKKKKR